MARSIDVLLSKIDEGVKEVEDHYNADLRAKELSSEALYAIRRVIQDCQSALDWTASAVKEKFYGEAKWLPYFPLVKKPADFPPELEKQIKGLGADHPDIATAFERHQPYRADKQELGYLHALAKVNKHRDFTPQTKTEDKRTDVQMEGGGSVSWGEGVTFGPGVSIGGVPVDPATQRPVPHPSQTVTQTIYVDWRFNEPNVSVLPTLTKLAALVRSAVEDIGGEAQL